MTATFTDIEPVSFLRLCEFAYTSDYTDPDYLIDPKETPIARLALFAMIAHADVSALAARFQIPLLQDLAKEKLEKASNGFIEFTGEDPGELVELLRLIYKEEGVLMHHTVLREGIVRLAASMSGQLMQSPKFQELLKEGGPFVVDFFRALPVGDAEQEADT